MWNVIFGRSVGVGGLGFGVERDEQASVDKTYTTIVRSFYILYARRNVFRFFFSLSCMSTDRLYQRENFKFNNFMFAHFKSIISHILQFISFITIVITMEKFSFRISRR